MIICNDATVSVFTPNFKFTRNSIFVTRTHIKAVAEMRRSQVDTIRYDTIRYIYVRSKSDVMAS